MKYLIPILLLFSGCATHYIPVPHDVYKYQPIPPALLRDCPGADWTKVVIWRDVATAAVTERAARQKCQDEIDGIRKLTPAPATGTR